MATAHFLDKTLAAVADVGERVLFSERYARSRGLLQSLDVRLKILTILLLVIVAGLLRTAGSLMLLSVIGVLFATLSSIPIGFFLKRVWLFVPAFTAVIILPAVLNVITPGDSLWVLFRLPDSYAWGPYRIPQEIAVTRQGLAGAFVFLSRVSASVTFAVLLTLTTRWADILAGLRALFVPKVFVMTLSMTYRYIFLYLRLIQDMSRARKSRTIRRFAASAERNWVASRIGFLYMKSVEMSSDVYRAMLSRGYHGEALTVNLFRAAPRDYLWSGCVIVIIGLLIAFERELFR